MFFFPITPKGLKARRIAKTFYAHCVSRAREAVFFADFKVPDTVDGRFEMIALHTGLVINRVKAEGQSGQLLAQSIFDEMFLNMEMACRQIGIGDLSVPKHIKRMMKALQGRALTYEDAAQIDREELELTMLRNIYATAGTIGQDIITPMAEYVLACTQKLATQSMENFMNGQIEFSPLPAKGANNDQTSQVA